MIVKIIAVGHNKGKKHDNWKGLFEIEDGRVIECDFKFYCYLLEEFARKDTLARKCDPNDIWLYRTFIPWEVFIPIINPQTTM